MAKGCEWPEGCDVPDVPIFHLTRPDSEEIDGDYCRIHAQRRSSQFLKDHRALIARRSAEKAQATLGVEG